MTALLCERMTTNLERLQLCYLATALDTSGTQATQPPWAYTDVRDRLIAEAVAQRQSRRVKTALQLAAFPSRKPLHGVDFAFQPSGPRARVQALATLGFGDRTDNLILLGPPGTGKPQPLNYPYQYKCLTGADRHHHRPSTPALRPDLAAHRHHAEALSRTVLCGLAASRCGAPCARLRDRSRI